MKSLPSKTSRAPIQSSERKEQSGLVIPPSLGILVKRHLVEVPSLIPVAKPVFRITHAQAPFLTRLGASIIFVTNSIEHSLSPSGSLRAFIKLLLKWFITLGLFFCLMGTLGLVAGTFIESASHLMMLSARNTFLAAVYFVCTILLLALFFAGVVMLAKSKASK